jgi:hypothetical protein
MALEAFLDDVEVVFTKPTPHGGEVIFQYRNRLYKMSLLWKDGEVETTLASQIAEDPIVLDLSYRKWFLVALKRFLSERTEGRIEHYVKDPKAIFQQGIRPVKLFGSYDGKVHIVYEFGGILYAFRDVRLIRNRNGDWVDGGEEASIVHFHLPLERNGNRQEVPMECQCGVKQEEGDLTECEYMEMLFEWVWDALRRHPDMEGLFSHYIKGKGSSSYNPLA